MQPGRKLVMSSKKRWQTFSTSQFLHCPEVELGVVVLPRPLADQTPQPLSGSGGFAWGPSGWLCGLRGLQGFAAPPVLAHLCCPGAQTEQAPARKALSGEPVRAEVPRAS